MRNQLQRREVLRLGGVSVLSAAWGGPSPGDQAWGASEEPGKRRNCIFMLLQGGPSHLDLWDPKPAAPAEVRGPFAAIDTALPGVSFGELMPRSAALACRLAVVRSCTHEFNNHIAGTYIAMTGSVDQPNTDREAQAEDFPGPGAILNYLQQTPPRLPVSVSLPTWLSIPGPSNRMPGQYGGFVGAIHDPFLIAGEPEKADFRPLSLSLPDGFETRRLDARWALRSQLDSATRLLEDQLARTHDRLSQSAYELLIDPRVREAIDLSREPEASRQRYGMTRIGQSLLLARRLVEAGVRFVGYNAFNQEWDTHGDLPNRYRQIVPPMDQAFAALVEDLAERGLLDDTLVINTGEFGRTPIINASNGRDHWPNAYSTVLAGGGVRGGLVHGSSDSKGGHVASQPVDPADILATMWHVLGIEPRTEMRDRLDRPHLVSRGRVMMELL